MIFSTIIAIIVIMKLVAVPNLHVVVCEIVIIGSVSYLQYIASYL